MRSVDIEKLSSAKVLGIFIVINLALRVAFFNINAAEYTDGILQITLFDQPNSIWPPLYAVLTLLVKPLAGSMESAGKLVSVVANVLVLIPIFFIATRLFNRTSATYACILYTVSPIALRWGIRVMTDSLFVFLFFMAIWLFLISIDTPFEKSALRRRLSALFIIFSALATLTRYQGIILFPLTLPVFYSTIRRDLKSLSLLLFSYLVWVIVPFWILFYGFAHTQQVAERTASAPLSTLLAYWNVFESFIAYFPYFLTYPIAFLFLVGIFYLKFNRQVHRAFIILFFYVLLSILVIQSVFSSFQSRYLFPVLPFIIIYAGYGLELVEQKFRQRTRWVFSAILFITLVYGIIFSIAVVVFQRETFGDIKSAALFVREKIPHNTPVYSNEFYRPGILCPKMRYWAQRDVKYFFGQPLPEGAVVCIHSAYGGSSAMDYLLLNMVRHYRFREIARFEADIIPLLPDVMEEPLSHQNPLAWVFRYQPQTTLTFVYRIISIREAKKELSSDTPDTSQ